MTIRFNIRINRQPPAYAARKQFHSDLSSASGLIAKVSHVPTGTKGVRFDTRVRVLYESRINPNSIGEIVVKLPDKLEGDVILVPAEFENDALEITTLGSEDKDGLRIRSRGSS